MSTEIAWTDATWNPTVGCSRVSAGCENCYAERMAFRLANMARARGNKKMLAAYDGLTTSGPRGPRWTGEVRCLPDRLDIPLHWRQPRRVFVDSMSDLFHPDVPDEFIADVFATMYRTQHHTYQVLTKRPERMLEWVARCGNGGGLGWITHDGTPPGRAYDGTGIIVGNTKCWPLPNVWLGYSASTQKGLDAGVEDLLNTPAAVRFLSLEPLLEPIDILYPETLWKDGPRMCCSGLECGCQGKPVDPPLIWGGIDSKMIDWVIVGGESGTGARPGNVEWIRSIREQCKAAKVPLFIKQFGARPYEQHSEMDYCCDRCNEHPGKHPLGYVGADGIERPLKSRKGANPDEWPDWARVREFPK